MEGIVYVQNMELADTRRESWLQIALLFYEVHTVEYVQRNYGK